MSQPFPNTLRSIQGDRLGVWLIAILATAALLAGWAAWFFFARLPMYAVSESARLEVGAAVHVLQAPVAGQVRAVHLKLGEDVARGAVAFELDSEPQRLQLQEERTRMDAIAPQLEKINAELRALQQVSREAVRGAETAQDEVRARITEAEVSAALARDEANRARALHAQGLVTEIDLVRARSESERRDLLVATLRLELQRQGSEHLSDEYEQRVRVQRLQRELTILTGSLATGKAALDRLDYELEQRKVRAPINARVGELPEIHVGQFVQAGDRLAALVPAGQLKAIAYFAPATALGRIYPGQTARLRLDAFPWMQFGTVPAEVTDVASEPHDSRLRVELHLTPTADARIAFQHGLPGTVEIEIGEASPARLVLRNSGDWLAGPLRGGATAPPGAPR